MIAKRNLSLSVTLDRSIEVLTYLCIIFLLTGFGAGLRSIGMYGSFFLWLVKVTMTRRIDWPRNPITYLFLIFLFSATVSTVLSWSGPFLMDLGTALKAYKKEVIRPILLFLVVATHFRAKERQNRLLTIFGVSAAVMLVFGFLNYFQGKTVYGALTAFVNPNTFGIDLGCVLPFVFALLTLGNSWQSRVLWGGIAVAGVIAGVLTLSRGAWVALFVLLLIWSIYFFRPHKRWVYAIGLSLLLAVPFALNASALRLKIKNTKTLYYRLEVWRITFKEVRKRPIFGWGVGIDRYRDLLAERWESDKIQLEKRIRVHQHSAYLRVLFHQGMIGLAIYLFLLGAVALRTWSGYSAKNSPIFSRELAGLSAIIVVYGVHGIIDNPSWMPFGLLLGWTSAVWKQRLDNVDPPVTTPPSGKRAILER